MAPCPTGTMTYTVREGDTLWLIAQRFNTNIDIIRHLNPETDAHTLYVGQVLCLPARSVHHGDTVISESGLSKYLRMLWEQHVYWTRLFIISTVFNLPDAALVTQRLLRNPKDFGDALRPIYGDEAASKMTELLTAHLTIAAQLTKAALAGNNTAAAQLEKQWYANADDIAKALSQINPHWSEQEWRRLLYDHLAMTKKEAVDYVAKSYGDSISTFDQIEKEALEMADYMATGIRDQFPDSFVA